MAKVVVKILGNSNIQEYEAGSVGCLKGQLGLSSHSANVNGSSQGDDFELADGQLVTFAPAVKGGC